MEEKYFMGQDGFNWFVGVVESRNDPAKLGRVQVRCLGYHSEDLSDIPSEDLPWAHVMHSVTDPCMQGLGNSPTFLVEGSWVLGFFKDIEKQQPVIMGSLPGIPTATADDRVGFNDPFGIFPSDQIPHSNHSINEPDTSRLARGPDAETHKLLKDRRKTQWKGIPTATKPHVSTVSTTSKKETAGSFDEPNPRNVEKTGGSTGVYPYNHVFESEAGHVFEIDDTTGGERLLRQHSSGTYEEIVDTGTKTVKVVGDNYELVAGASNIYVRGNINLTCSGTKRELIEGDYILEVGGDYTRKIGKSEQVKIGAGEGGGNLEEEINGNHGFNIANSVAGAVGTSEKGTSKDFDITIGGKETRSIGGTVDIVATDNYSITSLESVGIVAQTNLTTFSVGSTSIQSGTTMSVKAATNLDIKSEAVGTMTFEGNSSVINLSGTSSTITAKNGSGTSIELTGHIHSQPADGAGDAEANTNAPIA